MEETRGGEMDIWEEEKLKWEINADTETEEKDEEEEEGEESTTVKRERDLKEGKRRRKRKKERRRGESSTVECWFMVLIWAFLPKREDI